MVGKWIWSITEGTIEKGEDPAKCAIREIEEEIGYVAGRVVPILNTYQSPGRITEMKHFFIAYDLKKSKAHLESDENIKVRKVSLKRALEMIKRTRSS